MTKWIISCGLNGLVDELSTMYADICSCTGWRLRGFLATLPTSTSPLSIGPLHVIKAPTFWPTGRISQFTRSISLSVSHRLLGSPICWHSERNDHLLPLVQSSPSSLNIIACWYLQSINTTSRKKVSQTNYREFVYHKYIVSGEATPSESRPTVVDNWIVSQS